MQQKKEDKLERERLLKKMEQERIERFGAEFVAKEKAEKEQKAAAVKGPIE